MTALPEAKLAREAEVCYATLACVTDYDCWQESGESVTADMILTNLLRSLDKAKSILITAVSNIPDTRDCSCPQALKNAIATAPESVPAEIKGRLSLLLRKYLV
jgi:5'-methylthioadenosine phosphorylase